MAGVTAMQPLENARSVLSPSTNKVEQVRAATSTSDVSSSHQLHLDAENDAADKNVLKYETSGVWYAEGQKRAEEVLADIVDITIKIAEPLSVVGAIAGHVTAFVDSPAGWATVCVTHVDAPDVTKFGDWDDERLITGCVLSFSVVSLLNTDVPIASILQKLFD